MSDGNFYVEGIKCSLRLVADVRGYLLVDNVRPGIPGMIGRSIVQTEV
jgi:hypothetical protein